MQPMAKLFPQVVQERSEWLVLDTLRKGQSFNEMSALSNAPSPFSIEVSSDKAVLLKIPVELFNKHFGGTNGNGLPVL